jgi:hypothetical protein
MPGPEITFEQLAKLLNAGLFFLLSGLFALFLMYWNLDTMPSTNMLLASAFVALMLIAAGWQLVSANPDLVDRTYRVFSSGLFFLLLGCLLLFIAYWNYGTMPDGTTLLITALVAALLAGAGALLLNANPTQAEQFYKFCGSGLFFIVLGMAFLFVANWSIGRAHAGMSFVLVVLGVAVLLYGTGTQGAANLNNGDNAAKYNVAIAGGAGVLAFCVAYGIIEYSPKMRDAFQVEKKYIRLQIQSTGREAIPYYAAVFSIDGAEVPASRRNDVIEILVPYVSSDLARLAAKPRDGAPKVTEAPQGVCGGPDNIQALNKLLEQDALTKTISAHFYLVKPEAGLEDKPNTTFNMRLSNALVDIKDGGLDYPKYPVQMCMDFRKTQAADNLLKQLPAGVQ